jgi:hypothetical protein
MRQVILIALALAVAAWYVSHRQRLVRAREYAHKEMERWENEGGRVPGSTAPLSAGSDELSHIPKAAR